MDQRRTGHLGRLRRISVSATGLALVITGTAAAGTTVGSALSLGQPNSVPATTGLASGVAGAVLRVVSTNPTTGWALELAVGKPGAAPFKLNANATGLVTYLNADKVDGKDASAFLPATGKSRDADRLDGKDSAQFQVRIADACPEGHAVRGVNVDGTVVCEQDAVNGGDAASVDGLDGSDLQRRVAAACPEGSSIRSINADGTVTCEADDAGSANAETLDGLDSSAFARAASEGWRVVNTSGEPAFEKCDEWFHWAKWHNPQGDAQSVAFYKDALGTVHLRGHPRCSVDIGYGATVGYSWRHIFTLPVGYRPAHRERHVTLVDTTVGRIDIAPSGEVTVEHPAPNGNFGQGGLTLDGISFRAAD